ncbi:MAG: AAA domain-containing protein, partial [Myxococcota bacterium]
RSFELTLAFERPPPEHVSHGRSFIELAPNSVTYRRAIANLDAVARMESGTDRRRRDIWFGEAAPRMETGANGSASERLNPEQGSAWAGALAAQDIYAIHGPPGTGKSTVLAEIMASEAKRETTLLATASSNAAVDHLLELALRQGLRAVRVGHPARVSEALQQHTLDYLIETHHERAVVDELRDEAYELMGYARRQRNQGRSKDRFGRARDAKREARELLSRAEELEALVARALLDEAQVICATLSMLSGHVLRDRRFDLALVDEATQATEPLVLGAFVSARRLVLAGDPKQLPPTVLSQKAARAGLGQSALERVMSIHNTDVCTMLREQYRMNNAIMAFPSAQSYDGQLRAHSSVAERQLPDELGAPPLLFVDTAGKGFSEERQPASSSLYNPGEGELVLGHVSRLLRDGLRGEQISVISPYSAQVQWLRAQCEEASVEIDTIDAFQGRENDAVLLSFVRSNDAGEVGFLSDERRLNVALTRARKHLAMFGDSATLSSDPVYAALIEHTQSTDAYRSAWAWPESD